jgi:transcriptional regulator with XRE-family HTH domain
VITAPEYGVWAGMKSRCFNANLPSFKNYGGRGIAVCDRWRKSFADFLADMGPRPPTPDGRKRHWSIERIDVDGNYEPGNCRWATQAEQMHNLRSTRYVTINGEKTAACAVAKRNGVTAAAYHTRVSSGWTVERAVTEPRRKFAKRARPVSACREFRIYLRALCAIKGWGPADLAKRCGIRRSEVSRIHNGLNGASSAHAQDGLAKAFGVPLATLRRAMDDRLDMPAMAEAFGVQLDDLLRETGIAKAALLKADAFAAPLVPVSLVDVTRAMRAAPSEACAVAILVRAVETKAFAAEG